MIRQEPHTTRPHIFVLVIVIDFLFATRSQISIWERALEKLRFVLADWPVEHAASELGKIEAELFKSGLPSRNVVTRLDRVLDYDYDDEHEHEHDGEAVNTWIVRAVAA